MISEQRCAIGRDEVNLKRVRLAYFLRVYGELGNQRNGLGVHRRELRCVDGVHIATGDPLSAP